MSDKQPSQDSHKFDTLSLLAGLNEADAGNYSLDEILREYGMEDTKKPVGPVQPDNALIEEIQQAIDREMEMNMATPEPVIQLEQEEPPKPAEPQQEPEPQPDLGDPALNELFRKKGIRIVEHTVQPELPKEPAPKQPAHTAEPKTQRQPHPHHKQEAPKQPEAKAEEPPLRVVKKKAHDEPVPDAQETYKKYARAVKPARSRMMAVLILTLAAILWTAANQFGWSQSAVFASNRLASKILLGMMVLCALLSFDAIKDGVKGIFKLRFTLNSLCVLAFLTAAIDAARCGDGQSLPFCAIVCAELYFAAWGDMLRKVAVRRSLRPLVKPEGTLRGVVTVADVWEDGTLATTGAGREKDHVRGLLGTNLADRRMCVYAPAMALLSLGLAFVVRLKTGQSLLWAWSTMMAAALPLGGFVSFYRPFSILSGRLLKEGAAVSGWDGAECLRSADAVVLRDEDIFPAGQVSLGGMKVYGSYSVGQSVGYAAAVIEASGSGLTPLFQELRSSNNGRFFQVSQFRRYESGGYGAEIGGDVVLLGSLRFMQLMGVYMHEGTKVRNAAYLSVNGEMSAVFALNYAPSSKVRRSLRQLVDANGLMPLCATRDFMITPLLISERYKISSDLFEFPEVETRSRLALLPGGCDTKQGAILAKPTFAAFGDTIVGARLLRLVTSGATAISMAGGVLGLALMFLLCYLGAQAALTAMNLLAFVLIWSLPVLILTGWVGRY